MPASVTPTKFTRIGNRVVNIDLITIIQEQTHLDPHTGATIRDGVRLYFTTDFYLDLYGTAADTMLAKIAPMLDSQTPLTLNQNVVQ